MLDSKITRVSAQFVDYIGCLLTTKLIKSVFDLAFRRKKNPSLTKMEIIIDDFTG